MQLDECREKIDAIDAELLRLLNMRAGLSRRVGRIKAASGLPIIDLRREDVILRRAVRNSAGEMSHDSVSRIYSEILAESRRIQLAIEAEAIANSEAYR